MYEYEAGKTELTGSRNSMYNRQTISDFEANGVATVLNTVKNEKRRYENFGNGKYVLVGAEDRLAKKPYDEHKYSSEADQKSYCGGYYRTGSLKLNAFLELHKEELTPEEIAAYGKADYEHSVTREFLGPLKRNEVYMKGYNGAIVLLGVKDRLSTSPQRTLADAQDQKYYDYGYYNYRNIEEVKLINRGISDEEIKKRGYQAFTLGIKKDKLGPLLNNPIFMQGYNDAIVDSIFSLVEEDASNHKKR